MSTKNPDDRFGSGERPKMTASSGPKPTKQFGPAQQGHGLHFLYTYNNLGTRNDDIYQRSCGYAAMATVADFFHKNPYNLQRRARSPFPGDTAHFDNAEFVGKIHAQYPATFQLPFAGKFIVRDDLKKAFAAWSIKHEEGYATAVVDSDGSPERKFLQNWFMKQKSPVLTLLDVGAWSDYGFGQYELHWGFVYGWNDAGVDFGSWTAAGPSEVAFNGNWHIPWDLFMSAWHAKFLPWPNNYYYIFFPSQ
jgi:hypothetical protein